MADPIIDVRDLIYCYKDGTQALNGLNIRIDGGEFVALVGQNGCGKTTFSKCLNGIFKPTSGKILVNGIDTSVPSEKKQLVKNIGYVFQNPDHQIFNKSVYQEIAYAPHNIGLSSKEADARVREAAAVTGIAPSLFEEHPFFLPKGMRQRVAIASILSLRPRVIIVDEPTTGQDHKQSIEIMEFLKKLNEEEGYTILIITHEMDIVAQYARRAIVMQKGSVLMDGPVKEVYAQPEKLMQANVKPPQVTMLAQELEGYGFRADILSVDEALKNWEEILRQGGDKAACAK